MDFDIDQSRVLYGLGGFLGVISILYFGQELILNLSPTIKSFILLLGTAGFLSAGEYVGHKTLKSSFYIFSAFSYLSFLVYTIFKFQLGSGSTFLLLAFSSAVFIGLGYLRSGKGYEMKRDRARFILSVVIAVVALVMVLDVVGPQPQYSLELEEEVEVVEGEEFQVGVLEIRNDFLLSRGVEVPTYRGCLGDTGYGGVYIRPEIENDILGGSTVKRLELVDDVRTAPIENRTVSGNYTVLEEGCPEDPEEGVLYISSGGSDNIVSRID